MRLKPDSNIIDRQQKNQRQNRCCLVSILGAIFLLILIVGAIAIGYLLLPANSKLSFKLPFEEISPCPAGKTLSPENECCPDLNNNQVCDSKSIEFTIIINITNPSNGPYKNLVFKTPIPPTINNSQKIDLTFSPQPREISLTQSHIK